MCNVGTMLGALTMGAMAVFAPEMLPAAIATTGTATAVGATAGTLIGMGADSIGVPVLGNDLGLMPKTPEIDWSKYQQSGSSISMPEITFPEFPDINFPTVQEAEVPEELSPERLAAIEAKDKRRKLRALEGTKTVLSSPLGDDSPATVLKTKLGGA